jgi:FkbM family methyltransferase
MSLRELPRHIRKVLDIPSARDCSSDWLTVTLAYASKNWGEYPLEVRLRNGDLLTLASQSEAAVFWHIFVAKCYDVRPTDRVIVDAGANIGMFTVFAARKAAGARLISIEANPETFQRLRNVMETNHLSDRVATVFAALGEFPEPRWLSDVEEKGSVSSYVDRSDKKSSGRLVPGITLSQLFSDYNLERTDLLKVDIEGSEYETLLAAPITLLRSVERINVELHDQGPTRKHLRDELLAHLRNSGLNVRKMALDEQGNGVCYLNREVV